MLLLWTLPKLSMQAASLVSLQTPGRGESGALGHLYGVSIDRAIC